MEVSLDLAEQSGVIAITTRVLVLAQEVTTL